MAVEYRPMRAEEEEGLLDLWVAANPGTDREAWRREWRAVPRRVKQTYVAVEREGNVLASARYWTRAIRDAHGTPRPVGILSHVATRPEARRQGHAGRLLELVLAAMRAEGCHWSLLFTSEEARSLYPRYGWTSYPLAWRQGGLSAAPFDIPSGYAVRPLDPAREPGGWEALARIYDAFNARRDRSTKPWAGSS